MLPTDELLHQLENAHFGRSSAKERDDINDLLTKDKAAKTEADIYRKIWHGLDDLKIEEQKHKFESWEKEWKNNDDDELIEWYLDNKLGTYQTQQLKERYENDTCFSAKVDAMKSLKEGFESVKSDNFRQKINTWEKPTKQATKTRILKPVWKRSLSIAASILLLITAGFSWWNHQQYSDNALLEKYTGISVTGTTLGANDQADDYLNSFDEAHKLLANKQYQQAVEAFSNLQNKDTPPAWSQDYKKDKLNSIQWSLILSMLGNGQTNEIFMQNLEDISNTNGHSYQAKAKALKDDLDSFWRF